MGEKRSSDEMNMCGKKRRRFLELGIDEQSLKANS